MFDRGLAMRDDQYCLFAAQSDDRLHDFGFGIRIERTGDSYPLTLPARQPHAVLADERVQPLRQPSSCGCLFVTRAKDNLRARRVYSTPTDRSTGVIADQRVELESFYAIQDYPEHIRRIRFTDPTTGQTLIFLTNNTSLPATTIAALYKNRWQVELFFKWIKQHLRIKHFLGTSEYAVKTQIW